MRFLRSVLLLLIVGCSQPQSIPETPLRDLDGNEFKLEPSERAVSVVYFLSPECPLCLNYTLAFKEIEKEFGSDSTAFFGVHSGKWFSNNEVEDYALKYGLKMKMLLDDENALAENLGASVTPEVFVLNSKSEVLYSGKIDNWVNDLGKKKLDVSDHYLKDALTAILANQTVEINRTEPVGCLIE